MSELKLVSGAALWLRRLGAVVTTLLLAILISLVALTAANSNSDPGWNSEVDYALELNSGSTDRQQVAEHPDLNFTNGQTAGTWEAWIFPTSDTLNRQAIFSKETHHVLGLDNGRLWTAFWQGNSYIDRISEVRLPLNAWSHVAYVKSGTTVRIFLNGAIAVEWTNAAYQTLDHKSLVFTIGRRTNGEYFTGRIDEVRIWNRELGATEIQAGMHSRVSYSSTGLQGYWDFNEGSGSIAYDRTGNAYVRDLSLVNSPPRFDVKRTTSLASGETVVTFPRTYLPGIGGWKAPNGARNIQTLVVGGGGSGGSYVAGGGGGGGVLARTLSAFDQNTYSIAVGQGGNAVGTLSTNRDNRRRGINGQNSTAFGLTAIGGGGGGAAALPGLDGASGGGAGFFSGAGVLGGAGIGGQGFSGGSGGMADSARPDPNNFTAGAGGGGAGAAGESINAGIGRGGNGGAGTASSILGQTYFFGGGGGGGAYNAFSGGRGGNGGIGGGGAGSILPYNSGSTVPAAGGGSALNPGGSVSGGGDFTTAGSGGANTGGGGGGVGHDGISGAGGSGVVVVRYTPTEDRAWFDELDPNSNLTVPSGVLPISNNASFMVQMWIKPDPNSTDLYQALWSQADPGDYSDRYGLFRMNDGRFMVDLGGTDQILDPGRPISTDWLNVALIVDHPGVRLYLDGELAGSITNYDNGNRLSPGTVFSIGSSATGEASRFSGWIDEVKVFLNGVPSQDTIRTLMNQATTPGLGLAAYYDFNELTQGQVLDRSGNGKHLVASSTLTLSNTNLTSAPIVETSTTFGTQTVQKFMRSYITPYGGWAPPAGVTRYKALVVAGGGGGGGGINNAHGAGGGGAGGVIQRDLVTISSSVIAITVGMGGDGAPATFAGKPGQNSQLGNLITAVGGGGGGSYYNYAANTLGFVGSAATGGGSGGGAGGSSTLKTGGAGTSGQGNKGGAGSSTDRYGAGGGGAGAVGQNASTTAAGSGGSGVLTRLTGADVFIGGGGGGGSSDTIAALGGSGGGGRGGSTALTPTAGTNGTGGGGGGGSTNAAGADGGSGVVVISYGPYLNVTRSPIVARVGSAFDQPIQIQLTNLDGTLFSSNSPVTVTASPNVLQINGQALTQSLTVNAVNGIATFTGLGFQAGVTSAQTLTFTSDAFVGTTLSLTPSFMPTNVNIATGVTTGGVFHQGLFYASASSGTTNILASDLVTHMASFSTLISASGNITVTNGFTSASASDLVLRAGGLVEVLGGQTIRTHGGDIVLWADADSSGGGVIRLLGSSQLCTTGGTCGTTATGGGDIILGGGPAQLGNAMRPAGSAAGSGADGAGTDATSTGVQLGTLETGGSGTKLYSAGGLISVKGRKASSANVWAAGVAVVAGAEIKSGDGKIYLYGETSDEGTSHDGTIELNAWGGALGSAGSITLDTANTASDAILIEGNETGAATSYGLWGENDSTNIYSSGGLIIRANQVHTNLDLNLNVVGQIVIEPYTSLLRNSQSGTNYDFKVGSGNEFNLLTTPSGIRVGNLSNSNQVTLATSFSVEGPIEVYGARVDVTANVNISSTTQGSRILFRATDWIDLRAGSNSTTYTKIQTNNGDIVFWSDADGSGDGAINIGNNNQLNSANGDKSKTRSGGGRITLAGGNDGVDAAGHPLGFAADTGNVNGSTNYWAVLVQAAQIYSGGGDITIRGKSNYGSLDSIRFDTSSLMWSGTGVINVDARKTADNNTLYLYQTTWVSAATQSTAISINAQTTGAGQAISGVADGASLIASGTGGIRMQATVSNIANTAISLVGIDILSRVGKIEFLTNGRFSWGTASSRNVGSKASSDVVSSSADIQITTQAFLDATDNSNSRLSTSGAVTISPVANGFAADSEIEFVVDAGSFAFGNAATVNSSAAKVKISRDVTANGPIVVSGDGVTLDRGADLVSLAAGADLILRSKSGIDIDNGTTTNVQSDDAQFSTVQTNNGDIVFWADSDANQQGLIWVGHNTRINSANGVYSYAAVSGGGDIIFAGGADDGTGRPGGSAWDWGYRNEGTLLTDMAIGFGKFVDVFSGGGDIVARASKKEAGGFANFHFQSLVEFVSGTGRIIVTAVGTQSATAEAFEYYHEAESEAGGLFSSHATLTPAISISATMPGTGYQPIRLYTQNQNNPLRFHSLASTGGGLSFSSMMGSTTTGISTYLGAVELLSVNGPINFSTNAVLSVANDSWSQFWGERAGTSVSSSVAPINIRANGIHGSTLAVRMSTSGAISVLPFGSNFGSDVDWAPATNGGSFTIGVDSGWASATHDVTVRSGVTTSGEIRIFAELLTIKSGIDLVTRGSASNLILKTKEYVWIENGSSDTAETGLSRLQTNGGDLVIWTDADSNSSGEFFAGWYTKLNTANGVESKGASSGGGDIFIGGASDTDSDGRPNGFAHSGGQQNRGININPNVDIYSGGGDITMHSRSNGPWGMILYPQLEIFSGTGKISIDAGTTSTGNPARGLVFYDYALETTWDYNYPFTIVSFATASPAIQISAVSSGTGEALRIYGSNTGQEITIASAATIGGGVSISARVNGSFPDVIHFRRASILSGAGEISVNGGNKKVWLDFTAEKLNYFGSRPGNSYVATSSASISFVADDFDYDFDSTFYNTSGNLAFLPATSNTFSADQTFTHNVTNVRNLTIGKVPLAGDTARTITINNAQSVSGALRVNAGNLVLNSTAPLRAGSIALTAQQNIRLLSSELTTTGGDITLWSDATNAGSGSIRFEAAMNATTNGGDFTVAGGLDDGGVASGISGRVEGDMRPDGYSIDTSNTSNRAGVEFTTGRNIQTSGGDVFIAASGGGNAGDRYGMFSAQGVTNAGSGKIAIWATLRSGSTGDYNYPWWGAFDTTKAWNYVQNGIDQWLSSATNSVAIDVNVNAANGSGQFNSALNAELPTSAHEPGFRLAATGVGGSVRIRATGGTNNAVRSDGMGAPVHLQYAEILAASGDVIIESTLSATAPNHPAISFAGTANETRPNANWNSNDRVYLGASPIAGSPVTSSSGNVIIRANSVDMYDGYSETRRTVVSTSGTLTIEPLAASFRSELSTRGLDSRATGLVLGKQGNSSSILLHASHPVSISGVATIHSGSLTQNGAVTASSVVVNSDDVALAAAMRATTGVVDIKPQTAGRALDLGSQTANRLSLTQTELALISAPALRIGSTQSGGISISANITLSSNNIGSVRLSSGGAVTAPSNVVLTAPNLAVDAAGGVNLPGSNSVAGSVAISASSMVTYSSAVSYSPLAVDGVSPVFGVGTAISQTNSPTTEQANEFLAVTFNPPPQFAIRDAYSKVLDANNRLAYSYSVAATVASGSGTVTGLTTSSRVGGVITFTDLKVNSGIGIYAFTISASVSGTVLTTRSVDYNVMAGEPGQLVVTVNTTSAVVGQTGLNFTVSVRDDFGNAITAGDHKNITVSASVSGQTATIVSGNQVRANDSGIATFSSLVIAASTSDTITVSFQVTFTPLSGGTKTVTSSGTLITLTPGAPTQLAISSNAQTQSNRSTLSQVIVRMLDSYGNVSQNRTGTISATIGSGSGATLIGITASAVPTGVNTQAIVTFSNLALRGTIGDYRLDFNYSSAGVSSVSHTVTLTPGAATRLALDTAAAGARAGIAFATQPKLTLRDADDNVVSTSASISANVVSPTLSGTTVVALESGYATYSNLAYANTIGTRTLSYAVTAPAGMTSLSTSQALTITAGLPYKLVWATSVSDKKATEDQNTQRVELRDEWNNLTSQSSSVSITLQLVSSTDSSQVIDTRTSLTISPSATSVSPSTLQTRVTAVGEYRFKVSATGLQESVSNTFKISNGATSKLVVLQDVPASIRSGLTFSPAVRVQARDIYDNPILDQDLSISATVISGSAISIAGNTGALVSGSSTVTLPDLSIVAKAQNLRLNFAVTTTYTNVSVSSQVFAITFGNPVSLTVSPTAITVANRTTLPQLSVSVLDSAGNLVSDSSASITSATSGLSLTGTTNVFASSGVANFSALTLSGTVGSYSISFTATGLTGATTSVTLTHGVAASASLTVSASAKNAQDFTSQPVVRILDADGNLVTSGPDSTQTVELVVSPGSLTGTTAISASGGVATFAGVGITGSAGSHTLTGRFYSPSTYAANQVITLGFGAATKLTLETPGLGAASGIALTTQPVLRLRDSSNNIVTGVAHNIVASVSPAVSISGATVAVDISTGTATFTALSISGTVGSYSISFSVQGASSSSVASTSQDISLTHGVAQSLRVVSQPTSGTAGLTLSPAVIEVIDHRGNRVTTGPTSSLTIEVTSAAFGNVSGTLAVSLSNGVATFNNLAVDTSNASQALNFSVTGFATGSTATFTLAAGAATKLVITSTQPVNKKAGESQANALVVEIRDDFDNVAIAVSSISLTVQAVSSSDTTYVSTTFAAATISPGASSVSIPASGFAIQKVGSYKVKISATSLTSALSNTFAISNAAASKLVLTQDVPSSIRSGLSFSPAVQLEVRDQFDNPVLDSVTTISTTVVSGSYKSLAGTTASNQLGSSVISLPNLAIEALAGNKKFRFSAASNSEGVSITHVESQTFSLTFGEAVSLSASATAVAVANRVSLPDIAISVLDSAGNTVADSSALIEASVSGTALSGTKTRYAASGEVTFTGLVLSGNIGSYDLGFSSTGLEAATVSVTVTHGAADYLTLTSPSAVKNAIGFGANAVVAKVYDADGNLVTTGEQSTQTVSLSAQGGSLTGTTAVSASAGIATFSNLTLTGLVGTKTLSAQISLPIAISISNPLELEPGNAYRLTLTTAADGFNNREVFATAPVVTVEDVSGNTAPTPGMEIRVKVPSASISGSITASAQTGVATFASNLVLRGTAGTHTLIYEAEGTSSSGVISTSQVITLNHGAASQLVVTRGVADALAGVDFGTQPIVELRDPEGNRVSTSAQATETVEVSYLGNAWDAQAKTGVSLSGTRAISLSSGVGSFVDLRLSGVAGSYSLSFSFVSQPSISISSAVTLEPGNSTGIKVVQGPQNVIAGETFAQTLQAEIIDAYDNRVTRVTSSATLVARLLDAASSSSITVSSEVGAQSGLVSFTGLTFQSAGTRFVRFESGAGSSLPNLSSATTSNFVITHAAPDQLEWVFEPATSVANDAIITGQGSAYPELRALDRFGNVVNTGTVSYVVDVTSTPSPQAFTGTTADGTLGAATFQALKLKATVGNYTLRFRANTDTNAIYFASLSHTIEVVHGVPTQLAATTHPTAVRAGINFAIQPVIEIRDSAGNRVSSSTAVVSIIATGADLTGQTSVAAVAGIANFSSVQLSGSISGSVSLSYAITYQSQAISKSETVNLTPGLADYMTLDWTAADIQTRAAISPAPVVRLYDEFGNLVTLDNSTQVTAKLYRLGSLVTTSTQVFTASAGVVDFTGLTFIATPNPGYSLQFETTGLTDVSSSAVTVLPGPVERVEIVTEPNTGAGVTQTRTGNALTVQPRLKLVDFDGNIVTTVNSGSVTAGIALGSGGQVISASVSVSAGIAQFVDLGLIGKVATPTQSAEIYKLEFNYNGITSSPSANLTLKHNVAHQIVQVQDATGGQAGLPFQTQPKVKIVDKFGNTVFQDSARTIVVVPQVMTGTGYVETAVSSQATTQADGTATFNTGIGGSVNNVYRLIFRTPQQDLIEASQSNVVITHGEANQLAITREASASVSNTVRTMTGQALAVQPVIEIRDRFGNLVLSANEEITATLSSRVRGDRDFLRGYTVSAVAGVATFSNLTMIVKPEHEYQLAFSFYASVNAYTQTTPIWVTHALAEYITIERQPQGGNKTGNSLSLSPIVTVRDFDGNPTTMLVGQTVSATITQGAGSITANGQASLVGGVATFSNLAIVALPGENQRLTFTLDGYQNSASQAVTSVASNEISVTFNDPHKLALIQQPSANAVTADLLAVQPKVVIQDFYGNTVSNYVGSVTVQSQNGSRLVGAADETISSLSALVVSGVAEFSSIRIEGPANAGYTLDFNSGALQSTTSIPVVLAHTAAHSLEIITQPTGAVTGELLATQPSVRILDRFGNVLDTDNSAQVTVTVASGPNRPGGSAAQISGSSTVTVQSGVATFSGLKFTGLVNSDYTFRFATGGITVDSAPVRVTSAGADSFEWVQLPVVSRTGDLMPTPAVLRVLDFDGNLAVSSSDIVTVSVTGGGYIESGTTSQVVNGYVTFSNLVLVATPGVAQQLTFTATTGQGSFATSTAQNLVLTHTDASELRVNQSPNQVGQQGAAFTTQPKIFLYDRYGNKAILDNQTVVTATIDSGAGGAISGSASVTAVAGEANFSSLALTGSPGVAYTIKYSVGNNYHVVDSTVLRVFKTAEINVAYPSPNFSLSATVAPTVATTDSTENPLVFTSTTTQFCTVNSSTGVATIVAAGTCVIRVSVAGGTYYNQNVLDVNLVIQKAAQTNLVMTSPNFVDYGQVLTLTHSGGSSTAAPQYFASGTCRAFGNQLMMFGDATEGTTASCTVLVIQAGDQNFVLATSEPQQITVRKIAQAPLSIGNLRQTSVGDVDLFTVGGSGPGTVSYQVSSGVGTATCSIVDGNKLRATTNGWCEVSAQKNASVNYNTASSPVVVFTFSKQVQVVTFTSATPGMLLPGQSYQLAASASSGLTVSFAVTRGLEVQASAQTSYSPAICSLSQNTVTLLGTGTCEITATQIGNSQFASATAKLVLTVGQLNQVITFAQPEDVVYGSPTTRLSAQASSGLPVRYTTSAGVTACTVSTDGLLTLTSAGDCSVIANQPGDGRYAAAAPVTRIFTVTPDQASSPALVSAAVGNQWFTVGYTQPSYTGGSNIIGYRLEVTDIGTGDRYVNSACSTTAPLSCTMVGIPNSRTYSARVAAITAAGVGRYSNATGVLVPTNAEISVTQLKAGISGADLVMQWTPPAAVAGTFLRYDVYVWPQGSTPPSTPTATVSTLSATSTAVPVASMTSSGNITQSSNVSQPVFVNAFQVRSRVLVFGAINQGPVGFIRLASSQSQVATASNLVGYEMRVVTVTDQYSFAETINTATGMKFGLSTPDAPTQLTLDTSDPTKIIASWGAPNFDGGFAIDDYELRSNGQVICANIQTRMCEIAPLTESTTYRIEVRARNSAGFGTAASAQHTTPTPPRVETLGGAADLLVRIPTMTGFVPKLAYAGQDVSISGSKLDQIRELRLGGKKVDFVALSANEIRFTVPADTALGSYSVEHFSEYGKVTVIDAIRVIARPATESPVTESPVTESPEPGDGDSSTPSPEPTDPSTSSPGEGTGSTDGGNGGSAGGSGSNNSGGAGSNNSGGSGTDEGSGSKGSETDSGTEPEPTQPDSESEIALLNEPTGPIALLPWLVFAMLISLGALWLLRRSEREPRA